MTDVPATRAWCVNCETRGETFLGRPRGMAAGRDGDVMECPKGKVIFVEGQTARGVYVLCAGRVKLYACSGEPRALITGIAEPGDVLGLSAVVSGKPHEASAEAVEPCRLHFIRREGFQRLLDEQAGAWARVSRQLSRSYRAAHRQAVVLGLAPSAAGKLASALLEHHALDGARAGGLALTHEELGQLIGSSRETVTRLLNDFKRKRLVEVSGANIRVRDREALESLALAR